MRENESRNYPVHEDMRFQYASWIVERAAWLLLGLVAFAGMAGLFAHGWLSKSTISTNSGLSLEYERLQRQSALSRFVIHIPAPQHGNAQVRLGSAFQHAFQIEDIQPRPTASSADAAGLDFSFAPSGGKEVVAVIWTRPREFGFMRLQVSASGGAPLAFTIFVYP